ncbi:nucleotide binding protein, PINc domain protein [Pseudohyphozyma bogoriensis]|nr:nucleotide binding protein, PINc domain protein [Pseudohyphozyma bogoriensis]
MADSTRVQTPSGPLRPIPPGPSVDIAGQWAAQLRRQAKESATAADGAAAAGGGGARGPSNPHPARRRERPPSSTSSLRPLSTNPSLLSLENAPTSPSTTATTTGFPAPPSSSHHPHPQHRHSAAPTTSHPAYHHPPHHYPARSHQSLPVSSASGAGGQGRHREQMDRVYGAPAYDAEFDRGNARAGPSNATPSRGLYNPDAGTTTTSISSHHSRRDRERGQQQQRSRREPVDPNEMGRGKGKESQESFDSPEMDGNGSGRPTSRSSKESKTRKKREERRRAEEEGAASLHSQSSRLFDHRKDDPLKFGNGPAPSISSRKSAARSVDSRSGVSSTASDSNPSDPPATVGTEAPEAPRREGDPTPFVMELKKAYKEIVSRETKLQEEHRAVLAASAREEDAPGVRIQGGGKKWDDEYWVKLATAHKQLADAHYSFLQMALDPRHPASLHSLPQKYNIPVRLWQTGFHQLLERMRHAITTPTTSSFASPETNVLDHLVEFIQYAYGFYTQLFEDPSVVLFRAAWIEQLGDLARYRMAVAGLASRVSAAASASQRGRGEFSPDRSGEEKKPKAFDAASIGEAALGDWEVEEQESWRVMARDWYGQGVAETPGTGRLQHHLALLSKGDELRSLYHYAKSLTTTHPYLSARESILPLFEDELQARRTQPDVTKAELFVHLHGMLFTKISLDDFDVCLERFLERLMEEGVLLTRKGEPDMALFGTGAQAPFGDAEWLMVAVINLSAMLQYGVDDGVLKKSANKEHSSSSSRTPAKVKTPQAIMLNPASMKKVDSTNDEEDGDTTVGEHAASGDVVMQLNTSTEDDPLVFRLAQRLTFSILDMLLQHPFRRVGDSDVVNPYIIIVLTFVSHLAQHPAALRHLERSIPWERLAALFNMIPSSVDVRMDIQPKLLGSPLPEDWCIRGMDWTGRHLFSRGYWKPKGGAGRRDEMPPIGPPMTSPFESEMDALKLDLDSFDEFPTEGDSESATVQLAGSRWKRLATVAAWLVKVVPGFDFDILEANKFTVSGALEAKLQRWRREDEEAAEAERRSRMSAWEGEGVEEEEEAEESEDEDDDDETDSPAVRELKARRRQLKAVIKQARLATRSPHSVRRVSSAKTKAFNGRPTATVFPGYTVLVFDTNVMLSSMKLFRDLVEAERWTIIVPLAVVTELDGLKKNAAPLGTSADEAITYLETAIRTHSRYLKVQTSRGNYLRDLSIRSETIDFAGGVVGGFSHDFARSMDDVILRAVAWQKDHFTSRLALVNPRADRRQVPHDASTVVLLTLDRNLRLKAHARGLETATEKAMTLLLETENG